MISVELLSEILGVECWDIELYNTELSYKTNTPVNDLMKALNLGSIYHLDINIHELAHKCKEWARDKDFYIVSGFPKPYSKKPLIYAELFTKNDLKNCKHKECKKTEPEAIFKACQWILDNKGV